MAGALGWKEDLTEVIFIDIKVGGTVFTVPPVRFIAIQLPECSLLNP
jgi:hypothetical protein